MPDFLRIYAKQDYLTPGAAHTVELIAETVDPDENTVLLDLAAGKGEAAATLAGRFACRVIAVDGYDPFIHIAAAKFWFYNLRDLASVLRADGRQIPVRSDSIDASYCIGGPSIVGLEPALGELVRVTKPGGHVIVSDVVWREKPGPLGPEWDWMAKAQQISADEYAATLTAAGLTVERTHIHPRSDWEDYQAPMLEVAREAKTAQPADPFFAEDVESQVDLERRALDQFLDYATFITRKP
ncbi:MAG: methyltransferase domain-containing protein [Chloroflexi bacterium]|nr:methyltransferase domain-containing protein [Chloroflexota bacterium]